MVRTQIQLPDSLYRDLKRLAAAREWSLAETLRRGAELLLVRHPFACEADTPWEPPVLEGMGWRGLSHREIHAAALRDMEPLVDRVVTGGGASGGDRWR